MFALSIRRALLLCLLPLSVGAAHAQTTPPVKKVLFFTKSSSFEHSVIKEVDGQPSFAGRVLLELGPKYGIEFTLSKDGSKFTPAYLAQFDAYFFYTTGDLLAPGTDGQPPMTAEGKAALLAAVAGGKGFIGAHSATDTFHAGETVGAPATGARKSRFRNLGPLADPFTRMLGAEFIMHGDQQSARMVVADKKFPGLTRLGDSFDLHEEWYSMTDFSPDLHVLLVQDTAFMGDPKRSGGNSSYVRPPYPSTWARRHGKGRVFYTAMGHREDVWTNPMFQQLLFGGISWAVGNLDVDVTPNMASVTPRAAELPAPMPDK
ncbi:MAG: ThuA domain-containing protein [Massilia sp.]